MASRAAKLTGLSLLLFLVVLGAYLRALQNDFVSYDDQSYVARNPHVQRGLTGQSIEWAFTTLTQSNWHPITWISHMLDCQFYGLKPSGHHLTSVLLHSVNSVMLFLVFVLSTGRMWRSLFVAGLFGLHPLHVESVAWVAERKDVLSALFFLLTLLFYTQYVRRSNAGINLTVTQSAAPKRASGKGKRKNLIARGHKEVQGPSPGLRRLYIYYGLALTTFALGLMSKPMLVTTPFVLLLMDSWPLSRLPQLEKAVAKPDRGTGAAPVHRVTVSRLVIEKIPFLLLAAGSSVMTVIAQHSGRMIVSLAELPFGERIGNALISYCRYLGKLLWPTKLAVFYPYPGKWLWLLVILSGLLFVAVLVVAWMLRRSQPYLATGWFWFIGMLVPVIGLVHVGWQSMADRYAYLPSIGIFVLVTWAGCEMVARWRSSRTLLPIIGLAATVGCIVQTQLQLGYWRDSGKLFRHAISVTGKNYIACANLGIYAAEHGDLDEAIRQYRDVLQFDPDAQAHYNLGAVLFQKGRSDEALEEFNQALRQDSGYVDALIGAGTALTTKGQVAAGIERLKEAVQRDPTSVRAHYVLGYLLYASGKVPEAIEEYRKALDLQPDFPGLREQVEALSSSQKK